jgi:hypothetical protein
MGTVHWSNGVFATKNGIELPLLYAVAAVVFASGGYGSYSLDAFLGPVGRWPMSVTWLFLAAGLAGGLANVALRRRNTPVGV